MTYYLIMINILKVLIFSLISSFGHSAEYSCGMAVGYGPFQYNDKGVNSGIDAEIVEVFNSLGPNSIKLVSDKWDSLVSELFHIKGLDCLIGTEMTPSRLSIFKFSKEIYTRSSTIVVSSNSTVENLDELAGRLVCGDKDSPLEYDLINISKVAVRLVYMETKIKCLKALKAGVVDAAIMPKRVAYFLSKKFDVGIRELLGVTRFIDVGFAFKKTDPVNLTSFNEQLTRLVKTEEYKNIFKKFK